MPTAANFFLLYFTHSPILNTNQECCCVPFYLPSMFIWISLQSVTHLYHHYHQSSTQHQQNDAVLLLLSVSILQSFGWPWQANKMKEQEKNSYRGRNSLQRCCCCRWCGGRLSTKSRKTSTLPFYPTTTAPPSPSYSSHLIISFLFFNYFFPSQFLLKGAAVVEQIQHEWKWTQNVF